MRGQLLVGQVLLREVLRQALQPFLEQLGLGRCQLAVHQHQRLARAAAPLDGHSGIYETSLMLAIAPKLVVGHARLPAVDADLGEGILAGATCFEEAGGPRAYFGTPANASAELGRRLLDELGAILAESLA